MKGFVCNGCDYKRGTHEVVPEWKCPSCGCAYSKTGSIELTKEVREKANKELKKKNRKYLIKRKHDSINESGRNIENIILIALILFLSSVGAGCFLRFDIALVMLSLFAAFIGWAYTHYKKEEFKEILIEKKSSNDWDSLSHEEKLAKAKRNFSLRIKRRKEKESKKTYLRSIYIPDVFKRLFWPILIVVLIVMMESQRNAIGGLIKYYFYEADSEASGHIVKHDYGVTRYKGVSSKYYIIEYKYVVGGNTFNSSTVNNSSNYNDFERIYGSYKLGQEVKVYYYKNNPEISVLEKTPPKDNYLNILGYLFFLGLAYFLAKE